MIINFAQPVFAFIILSYTFFLLARNREWIVFFLLSIGCAIISITALNDFAIDNINHGNVEFITLLPAPIYDYLSSSCFEERLEPIAAAFVCLSIIIYSMESLTEFFQNNKHTIFGILVSAGMITVGNSYLHWEHDPGTKQTLIALTLSFMGFIGLIIMGRTANKQYAVGRLPKLENFFLFLLSFFVILPTVFGRSNGVISLFLWLPTIILFGIFLYSQHPCHRKE
jgi:hypothetical protein